MPHVQRVLKIASLAMAIIVPNLAFAAPDITGVWINDTGRGAIEIKPCGEQLCGHVVWVKDTADVKGCGRQIIGNAAQVKPGLWDNGWIYSPEKKAKYDVELKPLSDGTLRVVGYAGTKLFSRTMIWTRAPDDLQRCGTQEASKQPETRPAAVAEPSKPVIEPPAPVAAAKPETAPAPAVKPEAAPVTEPAKIAEISPPPFKAEAPVAASKAPAPTAPVATAPEKTPAKTPEPVRKAEAPSNDEDEDTAPTKGLNLKDLKLDKVFKRTASGDCKVTLPWVKLRFKCGNEE